MGRVNIDSAKLHRALKDISVAASGRAAHKLRQRIRQEILISGRIDTGEMIEKIDVVKVPPRPKEGRYMVRPMTKQYRFQDKGTRGNPYIPGRVLRFKPKGSGVFIFRKSTGPIAAAEFTKKAVAKMTPQDWGE